jgi:hypothetical protein
MRKERVYILLEVREKLRSKRDILCVLSSFPALPVASSQ